MDTEAVRHYLSELQNTITDHLVEIDKALVIQEDDWQRKAGGGGLSRVFTKGKVFEKAGINFSNIHGDSLPQTAAANRPDIAGQGFTACGVSLVIHPLNPYVPTTHMNVRFFVAGVDTNTPVWWFGGGFDLTPYYGFVEDAQHWHRTAKELCQPFGGEVYARYKKWCDEYFYLPHRREARGIGGLFFDDFNDWGFARSFEFLRAVGNAFLPAYIPIVERRRQMAYGERERQFQLYRRGRYVEFNLLYDRGTLFGLQSGGRTESILMSLPPFVCWLYDWRPEPDTPEATLIKDFLRPKAWV